MSSSSLPFHCLGHRDDWRSSSYLGPWRKHGLLYLIHDSLGLKLCYSQLYLISSLMFSDIYYFFLFALETCKVGFKFQSQNICSLVLKACSLIVGDFTNLITKALWINGCPVQININLKIPSLFKLVLILKTDSDHPRSMFRGFSIIGAETSLIY